MFWCLTVSASVVNMRHHCHHNIPGKRGLYKHDEVPKITWMPIFTGCVYSHDTSSKRLLDWCSLEPRLYVPDFVSQLWRKIGGKAWKDLARDTVVPWCHTILEVRCKYGVTSWCHRITCQILPGFTSDFSPKLWDEIRNVKPGFEAKSGVHASPYQLPNNVERNKPGSVLKVIRGQQEARLNPYKLQTCMHDLYAVTW